MKAPEDNPLKLQVFFNQRPLLAIPIDPNAPVNWTPAASGNADGKEQSGPRIVLNLFGDLQQWAQTVAHDRTIEVSVTLDGTRPATYPASGVTCYDGAGTPLHGVGLSLHYDGSTWMKGTGERTTYTYDYRVRNQPPVPPPPDADPPHMIEG